MSYWRGGSRLLDGELALLHEAFTIDVKPAAFFLGNNVVVYDGRNAPAAAASVPLCAPRRCASTRPRRPRPASGFKWVDARAAAARCLRRRGRPEARPGLRRADSEQPAARVIRARQCTRFGRDFGCSRQGHVCVVWLASGASPRGLTSVSSPVQHRVEGSSWAFWKYYNADLSRGMSGSARSRRLKDYLLPCARGSGGPRRPEPDAVKSTCARWHRASPFRRILTICGVPEASWDISTRLGRRQCHIWGV